MVTPKWSYHSGHTKYVTMCLSKHIQRGPLSSKYHHSNDDGQCVQRRWGGCLSRRGLISAPSPHFHLPTTAFLLKNEKLDRYLHIFFPENV